MEPTKYATVDNKVIIPIPVTTGKIQDLEDIVFIIFSLIFWNIIYNIVSPLFIYFGFKIQYHKSLLKRYYIYIDMKNKYSFVAVASMAIIVAGLIAIPTFNEQQQVNGFILKDKSLKVKNLVKNIVKIFDRNGSGSGGHHPNG